MLFIGNLLLLAAFTTAFFVRRDYPTVQADLRALYIATNVLTTTPRQANGTANSTFPSVDATYNLYRNFSNATAHLRNTVFTNAQANIFLKNLTATLYPKFRTALNSVVAKKKNYGGYMVVESAFLRTLSSSVTLYGDAVVTSVPAVNSASASVISSSFSSLASSALSAFNAM